MNVITKILNKITANEINKRLSNAIFFGVGGAVGSRVLLMLISVVISRVLGQDLFGQYSLINSTVQIFILFGGMGIGATLNRYTAIYYKQDKEKAGSLIASLYLISLILSIILGILMFIVAEKISIWVVDNTELKLYFQITSGTIIFSVLASLEQSILQGMEEYKKNAKIQIITFIISFVLSVILVLLFKLEGAIIALLLTQVVNFLLLRRSVRTEFCKEKIIPTFSFNNETKKALMQFTIPSFISSIMVMPITWILNMMLVRSSGFGEMAHFSVALQWYMMLTYIPNQLGQVRPIYTDLYVNNRKTELKRTIYKLVVYSTGLVTIVALGLIVLGKNILKIYGPTYIDSYFVFVIMLITAIIVSSQSQVGILIQASGKMWVGLFLNSIWAATILISFFFMKDLGALGYAISYLISYTIHTINSFVILLILLKGMSNNETNIEAYN